MYVANTIGTGHNGSPTIILRILFIVLLLVVSAGVEPVCNHIGLEDHLALRQLTMLGMRSPLCFAFHSNSR